MTRWARAGSSQRHHKTPGDATPWEELARDGQGNAAPKDDNINQIRKGRIEKKKHNLKMEGVSKKFKQFHVQSSKMNEDKDLLKSKDSKSKLFKNKKMPSTAEEKNQNTDNDSFIDLISSVLRSEDDSSKIIEEAKIEITDPAGLASIDENTTPTATVLTKNQRKKARRKVRLQEQSSTASQSMCEIDAFENVETDKIIENNIASSDEIVGKKKKKTQDEFKTENVVDNGSSGDMGTLLIDEKEINKKLKKSTDVNIGAQNDNLGNNAPNADSGTEVKVRMSKNQWRKARIRKKFELLKAKESSQNQEINLEKPTDEKDFLGKKKLLLEKLQRKKQKNGTTLLPSKVERKIFNIKRMLEVKGVSPNVIREVLQKERKHEEQKFKKTFSTKPCYNCREIGHLLSDCPLKLGDTCQQTGICFKCGSTEHTSYKCKKNVEGHPLAKCFICKEQGHISKDCPKNEHGVYIKGGKCTLCGNVNHLSKDCTARKSSKKEEDIVLTVGTINEGTSVDDEILEAAPTISTKKFRKPKVVKF